jgi:hypothetical protein
MRNDRAGGQRIHARSSATTSSKAYVAGPASSITVLPGVPADRKCSTVATTSPSQTTCSCALPGMTGSTGSAASPRISALAP